MGGGVSPPEPPPPHAAHKPVTVNAMRTVRIKPMMKRAYGPLRAVRIYVECKWVARVDAVLISSHVASPSVLARCVRCGGVKHINNRKHIGRWSDMGCSVSRALWLTRITNPRRRNLAQRLAEKQMISPFAKRLFSAALSFVLLFMVEPFEALGQQSTGYSGQGAPYTAAELHQMVAPIALYPDALVAQILGASTFPDQISAASGWLRQNNSLSATALTQAVYQQPWDPSVQALTQFPSVLDNLAKNLAWTSALGEAYHNHATDVMVAIQDLRAQAQAAGNLKSGQQIVVVQQSPQVIVIQPANPQVVYVPVYNPTVVYGVTYVTPGYTTAYVPTAAIAFGVGIAVGVAMSNSYSYWNCNWHGGSVVYKSNVYYGNSAWHGGFYGSTATAYGPNGVAHASNGYNPSTGTYARGASTTTAYGSQAVGQAYNPSTGAYGATHQASNASGNYGSSVVSKDGQTAYTQHQTTSQGSVGTVQTSGGGKGVAASGANGSAAAGQTANGNKYAAANGNAYSNTGNGWQQTQGTSKSSTSYSGNNSTAPKQSSSSYSGSSNYSAPKESAPSESSRSSSYGGGGEGSAAGKGSSSAFSSGGGDGWQSRGASSRGSASRGGGGGWGGRR